MVLVSFLESSPAFVRCSFVTINFIPEVHAYYFEKQDNC